MSAAVVMRGAWMAVMLVSLALAGCSGGKGEGKGGDGDGPVGDAAALTNSTALAAAIVVSVNGTLVVPSNGSIAVDRGVTLTFDASNSTGAIVSYAWDFGDNATSDERVAEHTYDAPGNYTVRLTVANGNLTSNATVTVNVLGALGGQPLFTSHEEFSGTLPLANPNSPTTEGTDYADHVVVVAAADANGTAALAVVARILVEAPQGQNIFAYWKGPDGTDLATAGEMGDVSGEAAITFEGPMPAGEYTLRVRLFFGVAASYTATVDLDYVTA